MQLYNMLYVVQSSGGGGGGVYSKVLHSRYHSMPDWHWHRRTVTIPALSSPLSANSFLDPQKVSLISRGKSRSLGEGELKSREGLSTFHFMKVKDSFSLLEILKS